MLPVPEGLPMVPVTTRQPVPVPTVPPGAAWAHRIGGSRLQSYERAPATCQGLRTC